MTMKAHRAIVMMAMFLVCAVSTARGEESGDRPKVKIERGEFVLPEPIQFAAGSDAIAAASHPMLDEVKEILNKRKDFTTVRIEGHTDNTGDAGENLELSKKRALAVAKYLVSAGVDGKRLLAVGFGDSKPVASNDTPEGQAQNRRITIVVAALRGRAIGGMPVDGGGVVAEEPGK